MRTRAEPLVSAIPTVSCKGCGITFQPRTRSENTYCSRACYFDHKKRRAAKRFTLSAPPGRVLQEYQVNAAAYERQVWRLWLKREAGTVRVCMVCAAVYCKAYPTHLTTCSDACQQQREREATARQARIYNRKRRARMKGAGGRIEPIDPVEVFTEDGWACVVCLTPTPPEQRGTTEPDAPELDHIVPLVRGGSHTRENVRTLCRACNGEKGGRLDCEWLSA